MRDFLRLVCLFLLGNVVRSFDVDQRTICTGENAASEPVIRYCRETEGTLIYRCCRANDNETFVAIDLMNAHLTTVPNFLEFVDLNLSVIDVRANPELQSASHGDEFLTLACLNELLLPLQIECPGGLSVWKKINRTIEPEGWYCLDRIELQGCAGRGGVGGLTSPQFWKIMFFFVVIFKNFVKN
jgi:hypothetical protein